MMNQTATNRKKPAAAVVVAAAAILLLIAVAWLLSGTPRAQSNALARTDLPGFVAVTAEEAEQGILRFENHSTQPAPVTFSDEIGRTWKFSAPGWNFLWVDTSMGGAMVQAHNVETDEILVFHTGHPDHVRGPFTVPIREDLVAAPMYQTRQFLFWSWNAPNCSRSRLERFVDGVLQAEEILPELAGQTIAFGEHMNVEQVSGFNTQYLLAGGSNRSILATLLSEVPRPAEQAAFRKEFINKNGLAFHLRWNDTLDEDLLFDSFTVYAVCGEDECILLFLTQDYLEHYGITDTEEALRHVQITLDRFSPFPG